MTNVAQATSTESTGYCGWANYETWLLNLWLNNTESFYDELLLIHSEHPDLQERTQAIKAWVAEMLDEQELSGMWSDLLNSALWKVDWREIATAIAE